MDEQSEIKTATFNAVKYEIDICGPLDGWCNSPRGSDPVLRICTDLDKQKGLETAIHESLHACFWAKSEKKVAQTATDIARFLWRLGYRRIK